MSVLLKLPNLNSIQPPVYGVEIAELVNGAQLFDSSLLNQYNTT